MKTRLTILLLTLALVGCGGGSPSTTHGDIGKGWTAYFSKGDGESENVLQLTQIPNVPRPIQTPGGCFFSFPHGGGHANYITRRVQGGAHGSMQLQFKIEGKATFKALDGGQPATLHPYFEEGLTLNNWWAKNSGVVLNDAINKGVLTITVSFAPSEWSNVIGQPADYDASTLADFNKALSDMGHAGITIGGWSQWGHGAKNADDSGKVTFTIIGLTFL